MAKYEAAYNEQTKTYEIKRERWFPKVVEWVGEHPVATIAIASAFTAVVNGAVRTINNGISASKAKAEVKAREMYVYDRSGGHYWKLTQKLTPDEWVRFDNMKQQGYSTCEILTRLGKI